MSPETSARTIRIVSLSYIIFGVVWGLAAYPPINAPARFLVDLLDWPLGDAPAIMDQNTMWLSSIGAGLVTALGVLFFGVVAPAIEKADRGAIRAAIWAMVVWYVIDSAGSIASGVPSNAVFNTPFLAGYLIPMLAVKHEA